MTIRRQPSDFRVQERLEQSFAAALRKEPSREAPFAVYVLSKASLTTPEGVSQLAKGLGVPQGVVEFGGLKDKHAQTTQHVSVAVRSAADAAKLPAAASSPSGGWSAERVGWSAEPLSAKAIGANRFTLVVRDLSKEASDEMTRRSRRLAQGETLLFTNYFGAQRFGSARHGQGWIAQNLIAGDFEGALKLAIATPARKDTGKTRHFTRAAATHWGDWKRLTAELPRVPEKRCIDALAAGKDFKAMMWNRTAHALLAAAVPGPSRFVTADEYGEMLFAEPKALPQDLRTLVLPLLAPSVDLVPPWGDAARAVLAEFKLTTAELRIPGLKRPFFGAADRNLIAEASSFSMSPPEPDDLTPKRVRRTVAFDLPRGSYATVVLRGLGQ
ncbi:MAG: tRNA pseudouridine(13) synthase TruD [Phycisphaerales bacterium]|nr:tRNA pseudouridine(13) synthase TruD [Phycisphaerales bacterium]